MAYQSIPTPPQPTVTPFILNDPNNNPNVPIGQTGQSYSKNFIGPIQPQYAPAGAPYSAINYNQPTIQSTQYQTPTPTPAPTPTKNNDVRSNGGSQPNVGDISGNMRWNGVNWEPAFGGYDSLVAQQNSQVENAFNSGMDVLNQQANTLQSQQPAQEQYITDQYGNLVSKANAEGDQLTADTQTKQSDFNTTVQNALQDATRAYTALKQQIMSRFGFGSSAGQGASDIASQEYYRTMGGNQQEGIKGTSQFANEFAKIGTFVKQKVSDLDLWKEDTLNKLKQDLSDKLNQIATAKSTLIGNKAYATMQVMQNAVSNAQAVAQQDSQFRQQLASDALNNMQQVAGRAFSPQEIKATLASFGINVPGGQVAASNPTNMYKVTGKNQDEFSQLYGQR